MLNWIILALCILGAMGLVALGVRWRRSRHRAANNAEPVAPDFIESLGAALGLEAYRALSLFGESIQLLEGEFSNLFVELEVSRGDWRPYVRIAIEFPSHLGQNVGICKDDHEALLNYIRRMREVEIGDKRFDHEFLLFGHSVDRLRTLLTDTAQFQLLRLAEHAESLRLTDDGLFVLMEGTNTKDEISSQLRKSIELAERVYQTAYLLGPSEAESEASKYQKQPIDSIREAAGIESRLEGDEPRRDADERIERPRGE